MLLDTASLLLAINGNVRATMQQPRSEADDTGPSDGPATAVHNLPNRQRASKLQNNLSAPCKLGGVCHMPHLQHIFPLPCKTHMPVHNDL